MREIRRGHAELWSEEEASYQGEYVNFEPVWERPLNPFKPGGPKIHFRAMGPLGVKACGQVADGCSGGWWPCPNIENRRERSSADGEDNGRDPNAWGLPCKVMGLAPPLRPRQA